MEGSTALTPGLAKAGEIKAVHDSPIFSRDTIPSVPHANNVRRGGSKKFNRKDESSTCICGSTDFEEPLSFSREKNQQTSDPKYHSGEDLHDGPVPLESPMTSDISFSSASKAVLSSDFVDLNSSGPLKSPNTVRITSTNEAESSVDSQTSSMAVLRLPRPPALEMEQATTAHNALSDSHSENNQDISRYLQDFAGSIDMKFGPEHRYRICFFFFSIFIFCFSY